MLFKLEYHHLIDDCLEATLLHTRSSSPNCSNLSLMASPKLTLVWEWVFDFWNTRWFWVFEKSIRIKKNCGVWVFEKLSFKQSSVVPRHFKKLQRIVELHERTGKNPMISCGYLTFFQDISRAMIICNNAVLFDFLIIAIIYQNQVFEIFLITMVINFDTQLDTWWGGGLVQFLMIPAPLWFKSAPFKITAIDLSKAH